MDLKEVIDAVADLNEVLEDTREMFFWTMETDGDCCIVRYLGSVVWSSEEDEREFDEDKNEFEPLKNFLIRTQSKMIDDLSKQRISKKKCAPEESDPHSAGG